ncbi:MAG: hypothetical protein ACYC1V_27240 [Pirellulaceae bacterium]
MAANKVFGDNPLQRRAARPFDKSGLDSSDLAGLVAVSPVQDLSLVQDDSVEQPFFLDVGGKVVEFLLG